MGSAGLALAVDAFLLELRVGRGLSPLTISAYRRDLAQFGVVAAARWRSDEKSAEFRRRFFRRGFFVRVIFDGFAMSAHGPLVPWAADGMVRCRDRSVCAKR